PLAGHIEPSKATCRIRPTTNANLMVTPPIFCAGYSANRGATASAHLPPKYPSCRGVSQDFAKSFSAQHGIPKYLSKRTVNIGKPTKGLNGISLTMLGMRHSFCRKRSANGPQSPSMSAFGTKRTCQSLSAMSAFGGKADIARTCPDVCFSNRPIGVKRFRAIHHCSLDVARGLVLLYGLGARALPSWDPRTRWNNLLSDLSVKRTVGPSRHANSPHPSSREGHQSTAWWSSGFLLSHLIRRSSSGPSEFSAINPDAMHNHGQPSSQCNDCLLHPAVPGDLHRPGLEPRPFCRT